MAEISAKSGRKPIKKGQIISQIRQRILEGELSPGSRLPPRSDLEDQFQSSPVTVQNALDSLVRDGFVRVHGRRASFVADYPPHLTRYGVVLPGHPLKPTGWSRFFAAIGNEAMRLQVEGPIQFPIYYGITDKKEGEDYKKLEHDIQAKRLAGLIFVAQGFAISQTPLIADSGVPCVSVVESRKTDMVRVRLDGYSFIDKALDEFSAGKRRRIAVICLQEWLERDCEYLKQALAKRGMETRDYWLQSFHGASVEPVRNCANLLMRSRKLESFDAVLIADDNLVEQSALGFLDSGAFESDEVDLIVHCNFPNTETNLLPVRRLGFDSRQILEACVSSINNQREEREVSQNIFVPALFENELEA